ncbi:hypothetical protein [Streptomyces griseus]|uniref:hypothetical protein n=1 Tax=Streptomyces griseus TaxID=1911 RepID=UPI0004C97345|nr:hypothetical protein [Streptomyces griseus]
MRPRTAPPHLLLLLLALALAALTGCGTVTATGPRATAPRSAAAPTAAGRADLEARARYARTRVEHVYVTEAEGYAPALQSAGVVGDDGFQITYVDGKGGRITLSAERRPFTAEECAAGPPDGDGCEAGGGGRYRRSGDRHAYLRDENGLRVEVAAPLTVPRGLLERAAAAAHRADDAELDAVLPRATAPAGPVERGDLPPVGDGAPDNSVGASG